MHNFELRQIYALIFLKMHCFFTKYNLLKLVESLAKLFTSLA